MLTLKEKKYCEEIAARLVRVGEHIAGAGTEFADATKLFRTLATLRDIQGNLSNDVSFAATLLAKAFLEKRLGVTFDAAEKPQGASGIDIDAKTYTGLRVVGEIKTTVPYEVNDFGSNQRDSFKKDFSKLKKAVADHKFLFVTDPRTFKLLSHAKYASQMPSVILVNLLSGKSMPSNALHP